jgi:hypothetical protein
MAARNGTEFWEKEMSNSVKPRRRSTVGCIAEPLEDRLLMALAQKAGKSGTSANLSTNPTVKKQQLLVDPNEPLEGSLSVTYDPNLVTLIDAVSGPGYTIDDDNSFVEVLPFAGTPQTTEFIDGTFSPLSGWAASSDTSNADGSTVSISRSPFGGAGGEGPYMEIDTGVTAATESEALNLAFIKNKNAVYNPQDQGEIDSIDYSENSILIGNDHEIDQLGGVALVQNGVVYYGPSFQVLDNEWENNSQTGLTADQFETFDNFQGYGGPNPDFSDSGSPITFGYYRGVQSASELEEFGGIDNWDVVVHQDDQAPTPVLESFTQFFGNDEGNPPLDAAETGYAQVSFFTDDNSETNYGNIPPESGDGWTNLGHVGVTGVDTFGLIFGFTDNVPPGTNPDVTYHVFAAPPGSHSGNQSDFLETQDGTVVDPDNIDSSDISSDLPPEITSTGGPYTINEGDSLTLHGSATDSDSDPSSLTYSWDLNNDGTADATGSDPTVSASTLHSLGLDDGPSNFNISLTVSDGEKSVSSSDTLAINNVAPTSTFSNNGPVNEGSAATVSFTNQFDPSPEDAAALHYSFATSSADLASSYSAAGTSSSQNYTYSDNGTHTIYGRIFDKDGGSTDYSTVITVNNVAPTATITNNGPINEGGSAKVSLINPFDPSSNDVSAGLHYSFATTTGALATTYAAASTTNNQNFSFNDNGSFTIYGRIFDKDGGYTTYNTAVTVNNVGPTASISNNGPINEGSSVKVTLSSPSDPSSADTTAGFHYSFAATTAGLATTYAAAGSTNYGNVTIPDNGSITVYGRIIDKDGGYNTYSTVVTVNNVAPTASFKNNGPVNEGSPANVNFTFQADPSQTDLNAGLRYSYALTTAGLATTYGTAIAATSQNFTFNDNGTFTVYGRIFDKDNGSTTYSTTVTVNNVKPTAAITNVNPAYGSATTLTVSATDPSSADSAAGFKYLINWGDGTAQQTVNATANNGSGVNLSHNYSATGTFTVTVTATDKNGAVSDPVTTQFTLAFVGAKLAADPSNTSKQALFIYGSNNNDFIRMVQSGNAWIVKIGNNSYGPFSNFTRVIAYGNGGNDDILIDKVPAVIFGGDGNDILVAGFGASIVDGGAGNDALTGLGGRDVLIGGLGNDFLYGGTSDDILIGGRTSFDAGANSDVVALTAISNEWSSNDAYATRISRITGASTGGVNGSSFFKTSGSSQNVFDDSAIDALAGGSGQDWFILHRTGSNIDLADLASNETGTNV